MFPFTPNQLFDQAAARHRFLLAKAERARRARAVAAARPASPPWSPRGWLMTVAALVAVLSRG